MCPVQRSTGCGGYFGKRGSDSARRHSRNTLSRAPATMRTCAQLAHRERSKGKGSS